MRKFHIHRPVKQRGWAKIAILLAASISILAVSTVGAVGYWYHRNIQPLSVSEEQAVVTIVEGASVSEIGQQLEDAGIIRSARAFQWYTRLAGGRGELQAGGYKFSPSESVKRIIERLQQGDVASDLFTILPAQRVDQIRAAFLKAGYSREEIAAAFRPEQYVNHPALAFKPASDSLEGYLYPESFHITEGTPIEEILTASLDQMAEVLTPDLRTSLQAQGLNVHQAVILASIVEREVSNAQERPIVAQVFLKRFQSGMPLGSDPTALYGALLAGIEPSVSADTPYNTRLYAGLPPGPINNVSVASLEAVAHPAATDFLYFVSGDDGKTYFSHTLEEHERLTAEHCIELCRSY